MKKNRRKYRVAIVGCGKIGALFEAEPKREKPASHAGAALANGRTELVAFVDTNKKNIATARELFPSATGYTSLAGCLKAEQPDIVIIATPPTARLALIKECARARVPMVVCEKPLAKDVREAGQIEALVARSGMTFVLNYQRRFSPLFARVHADIKKGKLGRIQQVTGYYSNGLYNNGGHLVDALTYVLGDEMVSAIGAKNDSNTTHPAGDENVDALLMTKKGAVITLQSFDQEGYGIHDVRIYGTKGSFVVTDYGMTLTEMPARPSRFTGIKQLDASRQRSVRVPLSATRDALAHVIECHEKRRAPVSSAANGVSALRILNAIMRSAKRKGALTSVNGPI